VVVELGGCKSSKRTVVVVLIQIHGMHGRWSCVADSLGPIDAARNASRSRGDASRRILEDDQGYMPTRVF
jgi:hypothetical protein